jgi:hypothetical protein
VTQPAGPNDAAADTAWTRFVAAYIEDYLAAHPAYAVAQGRHEYDGLLPDWSADGIALEIERLKQARTVLQYGIDSFGGLAEYYRNDVPAVFAAVEDEALRAAFVEANESAAAAARRGRIFMTPSCRSAGRRSRWCGRA